MSVKPDATRDRYVLAMWLLFLSRNASPKPEADGGYFIGDVDGVPEKNWERPTPYSIATRR